MSSVANQIVVHSTGVVIQILPLQPVALTSKTMPPAPDLTAPATPLFLGDSLSLPKIKTLWVDESESDSAPCKRLKTNNAGKEHTTKIADARLMIAMCKLRVHSTQAFLKDLVTIEDPPASFSPFSPVDCTMLNHFSFNDFIAIAFPDVAGDLDVQI